MLILIDKHFYSGCNIEFDLRSLFLISNVDLVKISLFFVDNSSLTHADNEKNFFWLLVKDQRKR